MNISDGSNEYQKAVERTTSGKAGTFDERLKMALIGLQDELGEVAGPIKKYLWHDHDLDPNKLKDEISDVFWYLALLCNTLNLGFDEIQEHNIAKLKKRYPSGFDVERSKNREE